MLILFLLFSSNHLYANPSNLLDQLQNVESSFHQNPDLVQNIKDELLKNPEKFLETIVSRNSQEIENFLISITNEKLYRDPACSAALERFLNSERLRFGSAAKNVLIFFPLKTKYWITKTYKIFLHP